MKGKLYKDNDIHYYLIVDGKIIADSDGHPLSSITNKLSLKNCQAIERGYGLDDIKRKVFDGFDGQPNSFTIASVERTIQIMFELMGDKKFSEEDVMLGWDAGIMSKSIVDNNWTSLIRSKKLLEHRESYKTNLKPISLQQTEWDVEIEIYEEKEFIFDPAMGISQGHYLDKPKLDADGCLILKKITNEN